MPLSDVDQACLDFRLTTTPPALVFAYDLASGRVHYFNVKRRHTELVLRAESVVITHHHNPFVKLQLIADDMEFYRRPDIRQAYYEYLQPTRRVPLEPETDRIAAVARKQAGVGAASFLIALTRLLHRAFSYAPGTTTVNTSLQQVLENKQGVCQDFAHLMLSVCRKQGIPARYVSGYLYTGEHAPSSTSETNTGRRADEERDVSSLATACEKDGETIEKTKTSESPEDNPEGLISGNAMHAWVECLMPDGEWRGFDPTNNVVTNDYYVKVHVGRDYGDVLPVRGLYRGPFAHTLDVSVQVHREQDRE
jgi:transglutaminase-like putative cysteine protease